MTTCRSCGALVKWLTSQAGSRVILDAEPVTVIPMDGAARGTFFRLDGSTVRGREATGLEPHWTQRSEEVFRSHFASCPQAKAWRKEK